MAFTSRKRFIIWVQKLVDNRCSLHRLQEGP